MSDNGFPGEVLREQREALALTLHDVHEQLHIPIAYVRAMEDSDLTKLPRETFTVGFLKSYCGLLGLDHRRFVGAYLAFRPETSDPENTALSRLLGDTNRWQEIRSWGTVCAVLLLLWAVYMVTLAPPASDSGAEAGTQAISEPAFPGAHETPVAIRE